MMGRNVRDGESWGGAFFVLVPRRPSPLLRCGTYWQAKKKSKQGSKDELEERGGMLLLWGRFHSTRLWLFLACRAAVVRTFDRVQGENVVRSFVRSFDCGP